MQTQTDSERSTARARAAHAAALASPRFAAIFQGARAGCIWRRSRTISTPSGRPHEHISRVLPMLPADDISCQVPDSRSCEACAQKRRVQR